jgi:DNA-binding protein HU-beta
VNRSQFLDAVAKRAGAHKRDVEHVWESAVAVIGEAVKKGDPVGITGFGKFGQRVTKARKAGLVRNPFTGEMVKAAARPAMKKPKFTPAKPFKEFVSGTSKTLPTKNTRPMALASDDAPAKKAPAKKKAAAKKTTARKPAAKKSAARKPAAKKSAARKPAARKTAAKKKPAARKTTKRR